MKIISVNYQNNDQRGGCDTCDYGSRYIKDMLITWEDNSTLAIHTDISCDGYDLTESDWILILANSSSIDEIIEAIKDKLAPAIKQDWMSQHIYYELNGERTIISDIK